MKAKAAQFRFLPVGLVAVVTFLLLRSNLCEWYLVPSPSMEPTLHGEASHGDLVLVDKTAFWRSEPRIWDQVVVRGGKEGQIVKRLICLGGVHGSFVAIRNGDVFVGPEEHQLARLVKDSLDDRDLRITHVEFPSALGGDRPADWLRGATFGRRGFELDPAAKSPEDLTALLFDAAHSARRNEETPDVHVPGHLSTLRPVDMSFLDGRGVRWPGHDSFDQDFGMEVVCVPGVGCEALQLVFEHQDVYWSFLYRANGSITLHRAGVATGVSGVGKELRQGEPLQVEFGHLDGRFFVIAGGLRALLHEQELPEPSLEPVYRGPRMTNLLHLGAAGGKCNLERLRIFRDLWYRPAPLALVPIGAPVRVEPSEMFLLGDNTFDSLDSRMRSRTEGQFRRSDLLGRPCAILAPRGRARWLQR